MHSLPVDQDALLRASAGGGQSERFAEVEACRDLFSDSGADTIGATLIDDLLVVRYLGGSTELARRQFSTLWQTLRPRAFGRPASTPRIWAT